MGKFHLSMLEDRGSLGIDFGEWNIAISIGKGVYADDGEVIDAEGLNILTTNLCEVMVTHIPTRTQLTGLFLDEPSSTAGVEGWVNPEMLSRIIERVARTTIVHRDDKSMIVSVSTNRPAFTVKFARAR